MGYDGHRRTLHRARTARRTGDDASGSRHDETSRFNRFGVHFRVRRHQTPGERGTKAHVEARDVWIRYQQARHTRGRGEGTRGGGSCARVRVPGLSFNFAMRASASWRGTRKGMGARAQLGDGHHRVRHIPWICRRRAGPSVEGKNDPSGVRSLAAAVILRRQHDHSCAAADPTIAWG